MNRVFVLLLVTATAYTQTKSSQQLFKSADGTFMFRYPSSLVLCQPLHEKHTADASANQAPQPGVIGWTPDTCEAQDSICPTDEIGMVCIAYPRSAYEGTSFSGGAFSVRVDPYAKTESDCLQFDPMTTDPKKARWQIIGGTRFKANSGGEGGMSHGLSKDIYLTFHNGRCYDIEIRMASLTSTAFDPETYKKMEFKDYDRVERQFMDVLHSFRFLKQSARN